MTNEKCFAAYNVLGYVADDMVVDALLPEDRGVGVAPVKKERPRRLFAFFESGWGVAIICALVAVSVMGGIIWAGNQPGTGVPPGGTVEPESQTTDENMMPPLYEEPNRTMLLVWSDGIGCEPKRFMVWSELNYMDKNGMGQGTTADGLGFLGTIRQEGEKLDLPKASFIREIASQNGRIYGISLDPEYILRQVTVYDMNLTEVYTESITESWETWDYVGCMNALASGEYYVSFYVTHDGSESLGDVHNCGQDYAFILSVTDTAETTRSCTVKTDKDRYEWGSPYYFIATLTSTVEGAYLQVDDPDAWSLVNLDSGERGGVTGNDSPYDTLIAPASPASYARSSYPLYFDWKTTPPGRYRLTYTGTEPAEGEAYPYYDFEICAPEATPEGIYVQGGDSYVIPKEAMLWVEFWDETTGTMLSGDGPGHSNIQAYASELPVLTVREGLDLDVMNAEIDYCVVYDANFEILYEGKEWINTIDYVIGPFYVVFTVRTQGDYIEEANAYEGSAHEYAFCLIVSGYCDGSCAETELPYFVETTPTE